MGLFGRKSKKIQFSKFPESYFHNKIYNFLWNNEKIYETGFFHSIQDDFTSDMTLLLGGNEHTYLALTDWRLIESYLANGNFVSFPYEDSKIKLGKNNSNYFISYINPIKEIITYEVEEDFYNAAEKLIGNKKPELLELTTFSYNDNSMPPMFFCEICLAPNLTNGKQDYPKNCRSCYRKNKK